MKNFEETEPDEIDLIMLKEIENNPDCHEFISQEQLLSELEEVEPDLDESEILRRYEAGDPDYQPFISAEDLKKELGL